MNRLKKGYIQVYTGKGKGKTTAALGQALPIGHCQKCIRLNTNAVKIIEKHIMAKGGESDAERKWNGTEGPGTRNR